MGMAASQARLLNLTARKTNIEYEGQQINQQRTELSNESANLYNQMLTLQVPTPPSTQDYTKVSYSFMMPGGSDEATVSQISPIYEGGKSTGKYTVVFTYSETELGMAACADSQKSKVTNTGTDPAAPNYIITTNSGKSYTPIKYDENDESAKKLHGDAVAALKSDITDAGDVYYINVGTESVPKYQYYTSKELAAASAAGAQSNAVTYYTPGEIETFKQDSYSPCTISRDSQNRVQSFTHTPDGGSPTTFAVTTNTTTDDAAYNDAMNEYTYQSYLYEQEMNNINAKTSIVQNQDRSLELRLKQLDTEHNAVQTEIDSVKSVCKKNVEDSFKTFA